VAVLFAGGTVAVVVGTTGARIVGTTEVEERVVRDVVRVALTHIAARFSDDAPLPFAGERVLRSRYSALGAWPADAEFGLTVLAWVLGPGFSMEGFKQAVNRLVPDFTKAAESIGAGSSPALVTLHGIARRSFRNASMVTRWNLNPDILYWPLDLSSCPGAG
jgi:hypothetical protein